MKTENTTTTLTERIQGDELLWTWTNSNHPDFIDIDAGNRIFSIDLIAQEESGFTKEQSIKVAEKLCKAVNNYDSLLKEKEHWQKAHDELNENFHNQVGMYVDEVRKNKKLKAINDSLLNALKCVLSVDIAEGKEKITISDLPYEEIEKAKEVILNLKK